ncbi:helix-turn-helix domain-containing protein, partial [Erwinia amylovora]
QSVLARLSTGMSVSAVAREFKTTRQTILRVRAASLMS